MILLFGLGRQGGGIGGWEWGVGVAFADNYRLVDNSR